MLPAGGSVRALWCRDPIRADDPRLRWALLSDLLQGSIDGSLRESVRLPFTDGGDLDRHVGVQRHQQPHRRISRRRKLQDSNNPLVAFDLAPQPPATARRPGSPAWHLNLNAPEQRRVEREVVRHSPDRSADVANREARSGEGQRRRRAQAFSRPNPS